MDSSLCIFFSGITVRFLIPQGAQIPSELTDLRCSREDMVPDAEYHIRLLETPLHPDGTVLHSGSGVTEYQTSEGRLRIHHALTAKDGCQVACLLRSDEKNILYYPVSMWGFYSAPLRLLHLLAPEVLLIRRNAFLLHSSVVALEGKAVLFSGASGAGKSTQAALWEKYLGAEIINGDRCVIMKKDGGFFGGGSPWCGTSGIRRPEQFPIAGIVLPVRSSENRIFRLGSQTFPALFSQTLVNSWDDAFMQTIMQLYTDLIAQVPVYHLDCRPDAEAVRLTYRNLFGKEFPVE